MNKKTLTLGIIIGILVCYIIFMIYTMLKPKDIEVDETKTYTYVLTNKNLKQYNKITSDDIVEINTQDDKIGEINLSKQIKSDLLDISTGETYYLSKDLDILTVLQDDLLLSYDEVISKKKEDFLNSNMKIIELESMNKKEEEGFDVDENLKANYENILNNFDISKDLSVTLLFDEHQTTGKLIEINDAHVLLALDANEYEYFQNIKDIELISIKLNYN